jgi:hypothetical protein
MDFKENLPTESARVKVTRVESEAFVKEMVAKANGFL